MLNSDCGVYIIISPSGGRYVGSSKSIRKRWSRYKNCSCKSQSAILASLKKYRPENHIIKMLFYCEEKELFFWERIFGDIYLASANFKNGLNISLPGYGDVPEVRTEEFKRRVSQIQKKRFENPEERRRIGEKSKAAYSDPALRKRQSEKLKEIYKNPELRKNRSRLQKEYFSSSEARESARQKTINYFKNNPDKIEVQQSGLKKYYIENPTVRKERMDNLYKNNPNLGKEHSIKLIEYYNNNPHARKLASEKTKIQFADPFAHPAGKRIINTETGEIYGNLNFVAKQINVPRQTLRNWLKGVVKNKTSFKYVNE